jgi:hypothetical protein
VPAELEVAYIHHWVTGIGVTPYKQFEVKDEKVEDLEFCLVLNIPLVSTQSQQSREP